MVCRPVVQMSVFISAPYDLNSVKGFLKMWFNGLFKVKIKLRSYISQTAPYNADTDSTLYTNRIAAVAQRYSVKLLKPHDT